MANGSHPMPAIAERYVTRAFQPDHVNLECLGNTVPHLHVAIIPRYRSDPRWGHPIWTTSRAEMPKRTGRPMPNVRSWLACTARTALKVLPNIAFEPPVWRHLRRDARRAVIFACVAFRLPARGGSTRTLARFRRT